MRKGINDRILEKQLKIQENATRKIVEITKGEQPFASSKVNPDEVLWVVQHLAPSDRRELEQEFGQEAVFQLYGEAAEIFNKRESGR